jgi:protoporphyrinogen IX oxidase
MTLYLTLKIVHILAVISWMAGILYLPRLMVYHAGATKGSELSETLKIMERRLLKAIMTPAMLVSWAAGLWLAFGYVGFSGNLWLHLKLALVLAMTGIHGFLARHVRTFAADANTRGHVYFRVLNEVPTVLMVFVVILAVGKVV